MSTKLKVVLVVKYFAPMKRPSGILNFAINLAKGLSELVDLTVITWRYDDNVPEEETRDGSRVIRISKPYLIKSALRTRSLRPNIIIFGTGIYRLYLLVPYFIIFRLFTLGIPVILGQYGTTNGKMPRLGYLLRPFCSRVIAASDKITSFYQKSMHRKVIYIPPAVMLDDLSGMKPVSLNYKRPIVGFFGHFNHNKGSEILFDTFTKLGPKTGTLIMAGEGDLMKKYQKQKKPNVHIFGYLPNVRSYIKACDLLVFPFRDEVTILGLSLSAMEAMAMGKPLLVSNNQCLAPLVKNGENGYIFDDQSHLEKIMTKLLSTPKSLKAMGEKSFKIAHEYDIKKIAQDYVKLIMEVLGEKK